MTSKQSATLERARAGAGQTKAEVQIFLDKLSRAVTSGDGKAAAGLWAVPALVLGDEMAMPVTSLGQVEQFFASAKDQYNSKGITDTRAGIVDLKWCTPRIAIVEVRWPWLDNRGREKGEETSTYTLRRDESGALKLHASVMHGARE